MENNERIEDEMMDEEEQNENGQIEEGEILKIIPLEEFLESNGRAAFSDDEDGEEDAEGPSSVFLSFSFSFFLSKRLDDSSLSIIYWNLLS